MYEFEAHPWFLGTDVVTNNTGEVEALGHALDWFTTLELLDYEVLLVSDSEYALVACQALQRCSAYSRLIQTVRRAWRREADIRRVHAAHTKGHSGNPWNELVNSRQCCLDLTLLSGYAVLGGPMEWWLHMGRPCPLHRPITSAGGTMLF